MERLITCEFNYNLLLLLLLGDKASLYCLSSSTEYLFSGGTEGVRFWHWNNITKPNVSSMVHVVQW